MPGSNSSSFHYNGFEVKPTVFGNGRGDAGGAKVMVNGIEYRLTTGGHFFVNPKQTGPIPWQDPEQFMTAVSGALEALKRFQEARKH